MTPRVFGVDYQFLSCGDVFTQGLAHAAADLGIAYAHAGWDAPDLQVQIAAFAPDLLFVVHGRKFAARFPNLKGFGVPTALWSLDDPYEVDDVSQWSPRFDHVFVNDPATLARHPAASSFLPVCYDPHVHCPNADRPASLGTDAAPASEGPGRSRSVGFIGGANSNRDRVLGALARAGLLSYVVGGAWADPDVNRLCLSPNINPGATAALYRETRIVVNIFREVHHFNRQQIPATTLNPRVYEATACGALVVSEWRPEVDELVPELPTFRTEAECVELVAYLLAHPVDAEDIRIRCAARLADSTYAARLETVLRTCGLREAVPA
jgi:hypothetical protein